MKNLYLVFNIVKLTVIPKNPISGLQVLLLLGSIIIDCYDLRLRDKSKEEPYIEFTQENSIKSLTQNIYLIYSS